MNPSRLPLKRIPQTAEEWKAEIATWTWTFAKTMPTIPHWYLVRNRTVQQTPWDAFAEFIAKNGYEGVWTSPAGRRYHNTYLSLGEWNYWRIEDVINRDVLGTSSVERVES